MVKQNFKGFKKALTLGLICIMTMSIFISNSVINSSAHNAYFLSVTIDENNFKYMPTIVFEENDWVANNHRETDIGDFTSSTVESNGSVKRFVVPEITYDGSNKMSETDIKTAYENIIKFGDGDKGLAFTFPGLHSRGFAVERRHANGTDEEMAFFVSDYLVGGLNDTISWMVGKAGGYKNFTSQEMKLFSASLANRADEVVSRGAGSKTVKLGSSTFTIKKATDVKKAQPVEGRTQLGDYVSIVAPDGEEKYALAKVNKGYQQRNDISDEYKAGLLKYKDPQYLNWQYIVLQANYSADVNNITFSSVNDIVKPGTLEVAISQFFSAVLGGLRNFLGLYPMDDVLLNGGTRDAGYYYGVMPNGWMNSANLLNFICQIIAWLIMGFAFVRMLYKRQLSTMNIGERVSLMEGIKDIFITCFLLAGFGLVFHTMLRLNYALVDIFEASSEFSTSIGTANNISAGIFASIIINFAFFFINAYFNVAYVLRGFTVAMLYALAPLAIVTISFGGKYKSIFSNFSKELIANVFLQTFHAMCVAFFTSITSTNQLRTFELLTVLMAFIPLTNFVRQNILGLPGGIVDQASGIVSMGAGLGMGAMGIGGKLSSKAKSGSGGGGGNSSSNIGTGINPNISRNINSNAPTSNSSLGSMRDSVAGTPQMSNSNLKGKDGLTSKGLSDGKNPISTSGTSKHVGSAGGTGLRGIASAGGNLAKGIASAGASIGFGAIGDKRRMEQFAGMGADGIGGVKSSMQSAFSTPELEDGGIKDLYSDHEGMTMVMDDNKGQFNNSDFNGSDYESNFKEMSECFLGEGVYGNDGEKSQYRDEALRYYKSQGIQGVGRKNNGNTVIAFSKEMANRRNFSLKDVANVAMFDTEKV